MAVPDPYLPARLRALRERRGLSLRGLAKLVPCSHVHIHDIERGKTGASPAMLRRLGDVLDADLTAAPFPQWRPLGDRFDRHDVEELAAALVATMPTAGNALRIAHEWAIADPPQVYELRAGSRIGAGMVSQVRQRVHQLRQLDDHLGGADTYETVASELVATVDLLRHGSYTAEVGAGLLSTVAELAQLAGWAASDAGRLADAERLYLTGTRAGHAAGDTAAAANCLSSLAYQWANTGRARDSVMLARTALIRARADGVPATVLALLGERGAWAHARAGDGPSCERMLGRVEDTYANRRNGDEPVWTYWLDESEIAVMAGRCWTELERPLRALPILRRATARYGPDQAREAALYLSWLAEALVQAGEVEEAAATARRVVDLAASTSSDRAQQRVVLLRRRLLPWVKTSTVREFIDTGPVSKLIGRSPSCHPASGHELGRFDQEHRQ